MNMHDDGRPKMGGRPCFLSGKAVIPALQFTPISGRIVEVALMLPVVDSGSAFSATWFRKRVSYDDVSDILLEYHDDPEGLIRILFEEGGYMKPDVYPHKPQAAPVKRTRPRL